MLSVECFNPSPHSFVAGSAGWFATLFCALLNLTQRSPMQMAVVGRPHITAGELNPVDRPGRHVGEFAKFAIGEIDDGDESFATGPEIGSIQQQGFRNR